MFRSDPPPEVRRWLSETRRRAWTDPDSRHAIQRGQVVGRVRSLIEHHPEDIPWVRDAVDAVLAEAHR